MRFSALVGEVMRTNIKKVDMDDSIEKAAQIMRDERIGSVVVTGEKNVKGIVTTSDIVYKHVASGIGETAKDVMSTDLVTIEPGKTIEEAAKLMVSKRVEKILVFDSSKLVGIITNNDILRIEPALFEILLERMKIGSSAMPEEPENLVACESCGNYSDSVEEADGEYICAECRE
ncbi:MAG: CBS domain-containing protein [Candidatus Aenigmarchaeota archaeon]|nr:CBS domain-containing protein [Candidatus Aenigmarchaeota archaeon]